MNCDQVFDILTRGPFPTGTPCDAGVEAHLCACPECRRLAEALRPALELFQEAVGPEESRDLPGYWCAVATDRMPPIVTDAKNAQPRVVVPRRAGRVGVRGSFSAWAAWRLAAALALGVTLGSLLNTRSVVDGFSVVPPIGKGAAAAPSSDDDRPGRLTAQYKELAFLPAACFRLQPSPARRDSVTTEQSLARVDLAHHECCTNCHTAGSDTAPKHATLAVSQTCLACHKPDRLE